MGMESYYIDIIPNGVRVCMEDDVRRFEGKSKVRTSEFINGLQRLLLPLSSNMKYFYIVDETIQLQIIVKDKYVQAIILQGCFTWFEEGLEICFNIVEFIITSLMEVDVSVFGKTVNYIDVNSFKKTVIELYKEKFEYFKDYLADYKVKIPPCDFYSYREKYIKKKNGFIAKIQNFFKK